MTLVDYYLNILQSILLPFALIPLIKFVGSEKIMGEFALGRHHQLFASIFGVILIILNFVQIFLDSDLGTKEFIIIGFIALLYIYFIIHIIKQPVSKITIDEDKSDSDYKRVQISEDSSDRSSSESPEDKR